ncbi:hypothetical protein EDB81DRAFT_676006 [Dactylonectria macrodidyma]|uniref:Nephrocystin 3-like N-terminal domain-containing protein n=1 Tax=Dactylonectria macrodidyma TaxID=307937 RepID=A0A9P9FUW5_9HYPO|nr:hypothetical protein EDB81DRAFT_676006 [Dactylonectria macrodidyma]
MDPLSLSASVAGLVTLADLVFRTTIKYARAVKGSRNELEGFVAEVKNLSVLLHDLSLVAFDLESDSLDTTGHAQSSIFKLHHLHDCQQLLRRLENSLVSKKSQFDSPSGLDRLQSRLKWPFSSTETKEIIQDLQRHKQTINLAISAESMSKLNECLSRHEDTNKRVKDLQASVKKILDIETKISLDQKRRDVLSFFSKVNPRAEFEINRKLRHPLTALWLTEGADFEEWYGTPGSMAWFTGIPGAGKSVIASVIISECLQRDTAGTAVGYFFCTHRDKRTQQSSNILSSLCSQLALQDEAAYAFLESYHDELRSNLHLQGEPEPERLIGILHQMCSSFSQVYLIIDGLDECDDQVETNLKNLVSLAVREDQEKISIALLSRDELQIRHQVKSDFRCIELEAHTEDIQLYVASELEQRINSRKLRLRDMTLKDQIMVKLVEGAKGMFRWVACHLDHMCELPTDRARRIALEKLPPTLPATYERILMRVEDYDEQVRRLVQRTLLLMSSGFDSSLRDLRLNFREICEAVSLADDSDALHDDEVVDEQEILRWCGSLVRASGDGKRIEFAHFTVQEYLQNDCLKHPILAKYGVSEEKACTLLGPLCLQFLTLQNYDRMPEATKAEINLIFNGRDGISFYEHAAMYWPYYVHRQNTEKLVAEQLDALFQLPKTPNFCLWSIEIIRHCLGGPKGPIFSKRGDFGSCTVSVTAAIDPVLRPDFTPLHMAAALGFPALCRRLIDAGASPDVSSRFGTPLHCSLASLRMFTHDIDLDGSGDLEPYNNESARRQTAQLFLGSCSNPNVQPNTDFWSSTVFSLATSTRFNSLVFEMAADLIRAGVVVYESDLEHFGAFYRTRFDGNALATLTQNTQTSNALAHFLDMLEQTGAESPTRSQLYSMTLRFAERANLKRRRSVEVCLEETVRSQDMRDHIRSIIVNNDVVGLQRLLENGRLELVQSLGIDCEKPTFSSVHIAVDFGSLDVLTVLLESGCDPNTVDEYGETPVSSCTHDYEEDMLRVLLQHGGSTTIVNHDGETIWHKSAQLDSTKILRVLLENEGWDSSLLVESKQGMTPICAALNSECTSAVLLLAQHCQTKGHWRSTGSLFQAAARMGSSDIVQKLLDVGVDVDGMTSDGGSPLHFLSPESSLKCVELLQKLFPSDQRGGEDSRTPLEAVLLRAIEDDAVLRTDVFTALLPGNSASKAIETIALWQFLCSEILAKVMIKTVSEIEPPLSTSEESLWIKDVIFALIHHGGLRMFEEENKGSFLCPFIAEITQQTSLRQDKFLKFRQKIPRLAHWESIAKIVTEIAKHTKYWTTAEIQPSLALLLSESIIHNDETMTALLLRNGVNIHLRVDRISSIDLACFPEIQVSQAHFDRLLAHTNAKQLSHGVESLGGCGPLHFTAASGGRDGSAFKLKRLLQSGTDVNLPLAHHFGSPLAYHILQDSTTTAEMLIDFGADPWSTGTHYFDASNWATIKCNLPILRKMLSTTRARTLPELWDRPRSLVLRGQNINGANNLHLAAATAVDCVRSYLDEGLFNDVEVGDGDLQTPIHYAARFNKQSVIEFLKERGGDINATCRRGLTPLHQAVQMLHLECVKVLLRLGAKHALDSLGLAYAKGGQEIVKALSESTIDRSNATTSVVRRKRLSIMRKALDTAIREGNILACRNISAAGCPVDIELARSQRASALMVALREKRSVGIVEWLVKAGATLSIVYQDPYGLPHSTVLEASAAYSEYNPLLPLLISKFLQEGGSFTSLRYNPLSIAIQNDNIEGLGIFLDVLTDKPNDSKLPSDDLSAGNSVSRLVNQPDAVLGEMTPLHFAAQRNNVDAVKLLIENMANIDKEDCVGKTALHHAAVCGSKAAAEYLIRWGARLDAIDLVSETPLMLACWGTDWQLATTFAKMGSHNRQTNCYGRNVLHIMAKVNINVALNSSDSALRLFHQFLDEGLSLHEKDIDSRTAAHWILSEKSASLLRSVLNRDARVFQAELIEWPNRRMSTIRARLSDVLLAIAKNLHLLRRYHRKDEMRRIADLANTGQHNLFCDAARWGLNEAISHFLLLGADTHQQCKEHGTPLAAAFSNHHLETVRWLVRHGANVPDDLLRQRDGEPMPPIGSSEIARWLLVERHLEQRKIANDASWEQDTVENWSGIVKAKVPLRWEWKQAYDETMIKYAARRQRILLELRGKIVRGE